VGDAFQAGVVVTAPGVTGSQAVTVTAALVGGSGLRLTGPNRQAVTLTSDDTQKEVRHHRLRQRHCCCWRFSCCSAGLAPCSRPL